MTDRDVRSGRLMRRPSGTLGPIYAPGVEGMNPWAEMAQMQRRMDHLLSSIFGPGMSLTGPTWMTDTDENEPDVDVFENDNEYIIHAALPGVKPEDIELEATDDSIRLSAQYSSPWQDRGGGEERTGQEQNLRQHRQSRFSQHGSIQFSYTFADEIRADQARAEFNNGRLELHLPKVHQDASARRARQIPVMTGGGENVSQRQMTGPANQPDLTSAAPGQQSTPSILGAAARQSGGEQVAGRAGRMANMSVETGTKTEATVGGQPEAGKQRTTRKKAA